MKVLSQDQQLECLRGFYHKNYESYRDRNPDRVAGTCEWFLRHREYREWKEKEASSLLWVSADPGCGKSVLAKFLVEYLREEKKPGKSRPEFVCHFFFKDDNDEQRSSLFALRALLHQIFSDDKALLRHAFPVFQDKGHAMFEDFDSLWDIFSCIAKDPSATNLLLILDALDECEKKSQSQLLKRLNRLYQERPLEQKPFFKVILLSRPENIINHSFSKNIATVRLRGEDQTGPISEDV
jgi:Cdc6-like AAA superfamily ATPase